MIYTIVAQNLGPSLADPVTVTDIFPAELTCSWTSVAAGGALGNTDDSGDLSESLSLPLASLVTYTVTCDIDVDATGTLSNTATISSALPDPVPANNSATDSDTMLRIADLSVTQFDTPDPVLVDSALAYTIQVDNAGPSPARDVRVTDILPVGVTFVEATGASWVCNGMVGVVICGLPVLDVGAAPPLTVTLTAPPNEGMLTHQVIVSAVDLDPDPASNISVELTMVSSTVIFADGFESGDVLSWTTLQP